MNVADARAAFVSALMDPPDVRAERLRGYVRPERKPVTRRVDVSMSFVYHECDGCIVGARCAHRVQLKDVLVRVSDEAECQHKRQPV